jgi:hypothetical protein
MSIGRSSAIRDRGAATRRLGQEWALAVTMSSHSWRQSMPARLPKAQ